MFPEYTNHSLSLCDFECLFVWSNQDLYTLHLPKGELDAQIVCICLQFMCMVYSVCLCLHLNALEFSGEILYSTGEQCLSLSGGLWDKPALTWPTSLLIQLWQPTSSWPGSRSSPPESGLRESQRPAVWSGTHATVNPSTLRPARLSTLSISYSSQERTSPPLPQNKQTEISENTITKKSSKRPVTVYL